MPIQFKTLGVTWHVEVDGSGRKVVLLLRGEATSRVSTAVSPPGSIRLELDKFSVTLTGAASLLAELRSLESTVLGTAAIASETSGTGMSMAVVCSPGSLGRVSGWGTGRSGAVGSAAVVAVGGNTGWGRSLLLSEGTSGVEGSGEGS